MDYTQTTSTDREKWLSLTNTERKYLQLIADGSTNPQAAECAGVAVQTVANALRKVNRKLGVHTRTEAVLWAATRGYLEVEVE